MSSKPRLLILCQASFAFLLCFVIGMPFCLPYLDNLIARRGSGDVFLKTIHARQVEIDLQPTTAPVFDSTQRNLTPRGKKASASVPGTSNYHKSNLSPKVAVSPLDGKLKQIPRKSSSDLKRVLYYTPWWSHNDYNFGEGQEPFQLVNCPVSSCFVTADRQHLESMSDFDAVLFHSRGDVVTDEDVTSISKWRKPHQRFVILADESPLSGSGKIPERPPPPKYDPKAALRRRQQLAKQPTSRVESGPQKDPFDGFFNWTMSYRWDADIPRPYGWFTPKEVNSSANSFYASNPTEWIPYNRTKFLESLKKKPDSFHHLAQRKEMVAWVVSNCRAPSRRDSYAENLQHYISVKAYGDCFGSPCGDGGDFATSYNSSSIDPCTRTIQKDFKFYLAFENALCDDYVTEKFFARMSDHLVIALGQADYSKVAPPHSFLHVMDYDSPAALGEHLRQLANDPTEYLSYFWWKDYYDVHPSEFTARSQNRAFARSMCDLCEKLHDDQAPPSTYPDLQGWWKEKSQCNRDLLKLEGKIAQG